MIFEYFRKRKLARLVKQKQKNQKSLNSNNSPHNTVGDDIPINSKDQDKINRSEIVNSIYNIIKKRKAKRSLTIGIEGSWGSGKTSVINLVKEKLQNETSTTTQNKDTGHPIILDFNPWMHMNQEQILLDFFVSLQEKIAQTDNADMHRIKKITKALRGYADLSINVTPMVFGIPITAKIKISLIKREKDSSLDKSKTKLVELMTKHSPQIVCIIDDIDRLDADEVLLIFKIVRVIADLPNIVFILSYDRDKVSKLISKKISSDRDAPEKIGDLYIDKIINLPIQISNSNDGLRSGFFVNSLKPVLNTLKAKVDDLELENQYREEFSGILKTPRDIKRLSSTISVTLEVIGTDEVNIQDFLRIEVIRLYSPDTYQKILNNKGILTNFTSRDRGEHDKLVNRIDASNSENIRKILDPLFLYANRTQDYYKLRLASKHHWDKYFSLSASEEKLSPVEIHKILSLT